MIHDRSLNREAGEYWACERPESPPDAGIWWDEKCAGCVMMYDAVIANGLGRKFVIYPADDGWSEAWNGVDAIDLEDAPIRKWREMGLV